jgi:hypothetical protein
MPSQPRNMPEQERSIKARSHELFVQPLQAAEGTRPTKPFPDYIRETPAHPMSSLTKSIFWLVGIVVVGLFLAAIWRITHHNRPQRPARKPAATSVVVPRRTDIPWRITDRRVGSAGASSPGLPGNPDATSLFAV